MHRPSPYLGLGWVLAISLAGCQRGSEDAPQPTVASTATAASAISGSIVDDPSLPPASQAFGASGVPADAASGAPATAGKDTRANDPAGSMTKHEESTQMPKAGQTNNYSSPSVEGGSKN
ncbi:MAG TPA: hypothetical protein VLU41_15300 [Ideonella sp.]|nr:hypothetical protein [Ideonella sp.]